MNMAGTVPQQHVPARYTVDVATQILIWTEDNGRVFGERLHNLTCVTARHHHIGERFSCSRGVHVADDSMVG